MTLLTSSYGVGIQQYYFQFHFFVTMVTWLNSSHCCVTMVTWLNYCHCCVTMVSCLNSCHCCVTMVTWLNSCHCCVTMVTCLNSCPAKLVVAFFIHFKLDSLIQFAPSNYKKNIFIFKMDCAFAKKSFLYIADIFFKEHVVFNLF